jgi:2-polyprenyl-6-hydroxyphenyl methylase/3-demethylubiquinone-9 3-methyltransferase
MAQMSNIYTVNISYLPKDKAQSTNKKRRYEVMTVDKTLRIDNDLYSEMSSTWWSDDGVGAMLRQISTPWRLPYFQRVLTGQLSDNSGKCLLDVGCGGGILAEEFAAMGFAVTGLDPSEKLLDAARDHANANGLSIDYQAGYGHELPYEDESFDIVACCDTLEHIENWDAVIGEIARVLKNNGLFLFDTINRTIISKIFLIKMAQEWKFTRFLPPNLHDWQMFIKPQELQSAIERFGLRQKEIKGTQPANPIPVALSAHQYNTGKMSLTEFAKRISPRQGSDMAGFYMGYATKDGKY